MRRRRHLRLGFPACGGAGIAQSAMTEEAGAFFISVDSRQSLVDSKVGMNRSAQGSPYVGTRMPNTRHPIRLYNDSHRVTDD